MSARAEMLEELREGGSGTARQLAERVGMNVETARRALRQLEQDGVVWGDSYQKRARVYGLEDEDGGA